MRTLFISVLALLGCTSNSQNKSLTPPVESIFNLSFKDIDGNVVKMEQYKGKQILIVNTASECGYTPQYQDLQKLHEAYPNLVMIGFPCNQFMGQEPGSPEEIATFCSTTYGVTFPLLEKIDVNGDNRHPIYQQLTDVADAEGVNGDIRWNFEKFLVNGSGEILGRFSPMITPEDPALVAAIESHLK